MEELYRILKPNGEIKIIVPYFRSVWAFADPTHKHYFTSRSFDYYDRDNLIFKRYNYTNVKFKISKIVFNKTLDKHFLKKILIKFVNKWPWRYKCYLSQFIALDDITFYLQKIK